MAAETQETVFSYKIKKGRVVSLRLKDQADPDAVEREIKGDISRMKLRDAAEKAKEYHKTKADKRSENLLAACYYARIHHMLDKGMVIEARELLQALDSKLSVKDQDFEQMHHRLSLLNGDYDTVLKLLDNPALDRQRRVGLEALLRQTVSDVSKIAGSDVLSENHPLRKGAKGIQRAFEQVTTGPVSEEDVFLPEVSRRSPLYPWKMLIRAIAFLYQDKADKCLEVIGQVDSSDAVYKLAVVIEDVQKGQLRDNATAAQRALFGWLRGERPALTSALEVLDTAMEGRDERRVPALIRDAIRLCKTYEPHRVERLKQHIFAKGAAIDLDPQKVCSAFGSPEAHNAYFWRLFAQVMECVGNELMACVLWEEFRRHALHEQWFVADSLEEGMIYLHMAEIIQRIDPDELAYHYDAFSEHFEGLDEFYYDQPAEIRTVAAAEYDLDDPYFLDPVRLFERAAACQTGNDVYAKWLAWAEAYGSVAEENAIAQRWHQAFGDDIRPVLKLTHLAAGRQAYNKGLKWVQKAEQIDPLNPEIRNAKRRLIFSKATRHLKQEKLHLFEKDLEEIARQQQADQGDISILVKGLEWIYYTLRAERSQADMCVEQIKEGLGNEMAAWLLLICVGDGCGQNKLLDAQWFAAKAVKSRPEPIDAVGRVLLMLEKAGFELTLPNKWFAPLTRAVEKQETGFTPEHLLGFARCLARFRADRKMKELLFALTAKGVRLDGPHRAAFLAFRAQTLTYLDGPRRERCLKAAAELARRAGNTDLYSKAVDQLKSGFYGGIGPQDLALDEAALDEIIAVESSAKKLPAKPAESKGGWYKTSSLPRAGAGPLPDTEFMPDTACECPRCRKARQKSDREQKPSKPSAFEPTLFDDLDEAEDFYDDDLSDQIPVPAGGPVGMDPIALLAKIVSLNGGQIPSKKRLNQILNANPELMQQVAAMMFSGGLDGMLEDEGLDEDADDYSDDYYDDDGMPPLPGPKRGRLNRKERRKKRKKERKNRKR